MPATLIVSCAHALDDSMPAADIATALCKNFLRLTFIAVTFLAAAGTSISKP